ncbi:MAG: hypothetical protein F6K39_39565, partial [Okeania sp. SIO3B3]|nr:hypothetical protein [Okeania sp. SIO3B3]
LLKAIRFDKAGKATIMNEVPIQGRKVPFRPLVMGGDDLTFVCDGRLALALTTFYLQAFEKQTEKHVPSGPVHACAGIAVVKTHYPFARAYQLADALCSSAKQWAKRDNADMSALDWHFAHSGLMGDLSLIRQREYTPQFDRQSKLHMRPLALLEQPDSWRSWPVFEQVMHKFQTEKIWKGRRNKVKGLREALRAGPDAVIQFQAAYDVTLPTIDGNYPGLQDTGWAMQRCGYFDAIEATDFYVALNSTEACQ